MLEVSLGNPRRIAAGFPEQSRSIPGAVPEQSRRIPGEIPQDN